MAPDGHMDLTATLRGLLEPLVVSQQPADTEHQQVLSVREDLGDDFRKRGLAGSLHN